MALFSPQESSAATTGYLEKSQIPDVLNPPGGLRVRRRWSRRLRPSGRAVGSRWWSKVFLQRVGLASATSRTRLRYCTTVLTRFTPFARLATVAAAIPAVTFFLTVEFFFCAFRLARDCLRRFFFGPTESGTSSSPDLSRAFPRRGCLLRRLRTVTPADRDVTGGHRCECVILCPEGL